MPGSVLIEDRISQRYSQLSGKLKIAADFIVGNPLDVASRSLRSIATAAGLSPATFSRLAKALDYGSYEELREEGRQRVSGQLESFSERAVRLREEHTDNPALGIMEMQRDKCRANIDAFFSEVDEERMQDAANSILNARKVCLIGSLGSSSLLDYFSYMAGWFLENWHVAGRNGVTLASTLANVGKDDVVVILSIAPFAKRSVAAAKSAMERGAKVIVITDSHTFPGLNFADSHFLVRTDSSNFFASYTVIIVLIETIISMMASLSGEKADAAINRVELENQKLEEI